MATWPGWITAFPSTRRRRSHLQTNHIKILIFLVEYYNCQCDVINHFLFRIAVSSFFLVIKTFNKSCVFYFVGFLSIYKKALGFSAFCALLFSVLVPPTNFPTKHFSLCLSLSMEETSKLQLPETFLSFLEANGLDPSIYTHGNSIPRYVR